MNNIFYVCNEKLPNLKTLILSQKNINIYRAYCYNDILSHRIFLNNEQTLYIITDSNIYNQYINKYSDNNIFICITETTNIDKYCEYIKYIIVNIYKIDKNNQYLEILMKDLKKKSNQNNHIDLIYKYLLDFQSKKNNQKEKNKSFINKLIYKEINFYALFNINLANKNYIDFEKNMRNYIYAYGCINPENVLALKIYKFN